MHNIHFIKVEAKSCEEAIYKINSELSIENEDADYFNVIGAYNLNNPTDYCTKSDNACESLISILGEEPSQFTSKVKEILNMDVKTVSQVTKELMELIERINSISEEKIKGTLPWAISIKAKEYRGCIQITNVIEQTKYDNEWTEEGLTYFDDCGNSPTHLVLVDFHS